MLVSKEKKFVFFHTPRTGGSSISKAIAPYCGFEFSQDTVHKHHEIAMHHTMSVAKRQYDTLWYNDSRLQIQYYFKFAFVREPVERIISAYFYNNIITPIVDYCRSQIPYETYQYSNSFVPQSFLLDRQMDLDFIGRYETLQEDWKTICGILDLDYEYGLEWINESIPMAPCASRSVDRYYSRITPNEIQELKSIYREDYNRFNYI